MNYEDLINLLVESFKTGVPKNITADKLREALIKVVEFANITRGDFQGTATPSSNPGTPDGPVYYFAQQSGVYTNFGGISVTASEGLNILSYSGSSWSKSVVPVDLSGLVDEFGNELALKSDKQQVFSPVPANPNSRAIVEAFFNDYDDEFEYFIDIFYRQHSTQGTRLRIQKKLLADDSVSVYYYLNKGMDPVSGKRVETLAGATLLVDWDVISEGNGNNNYFFKFSKSVSNIDDTVFLKALFLETEIKNTSQSVSAISGRVDSVFNVLEQIATLQAVGVNLIKPDNIEVGSYNASGNPVANSSYRRTINPIPVYNMETNVYTYKGYLYSSNSILIYDKDMVRLQVIPGAANLYELDINDRVSVDKSEVAYMHLSSVDSREMQLYCSETHAHFDSVETNKTYAVEGMMAVAKSASRVQISHKHGSGKDLYILFEKSMFNQLFTYKQIAYMENSDQRAGMNFSRGKTNILTTGSDNIGPYSISGSGWTGGNHSYNEEGEIKTAETESWQCYADGKLMADGDLLSAKKVMIRVRNRIYDPRVAPGSGSSILSSLLCYEDVSYVIEEGDISVSVTQTWQNAVTVGTYYGQQTVTLLDEYMTSSGDTNGFVARSGAISMVKEDFPGFDRFIQRKNDKSVYESLWLNTLYKLGNHALIGLGDVIGNVSASKLYHSLIKSTPITAGQRTSWNGLYSWKLPITDTSNFIVFDYRFNGKKYLAIDIKQAFSGIIDLMGKFSLEKVFVLKKEDTIIIGDTIDSVGIEVEASGPGAVYLELPY